MRLAGTPLHHGSSPREWGTHALTAGYAVERGGSSPREWGTPGRRNGQALTMRFIPTRVGNTRLMRYTGVRTPVHPHASGEHPVSAKIADRPRGSSPREWGTLAAQGLGGTDRRFIPTRVGNTHTMAKAGN